MIPALKRGVARSLLRSGLIEAIERRRRGRKGIILMYHRVNDAADPYFPALDTASFESQLDHVRATYRVETVDALLDWTRSGPDGPPRVAITIDDGYVDTHAVALPRLRERSLPATLFLATAPPETGRALWLDYLRSLFKHTHATSVELPSLGLGPFPLASDAQRLAALGRIAARLKRAGAETVDAAVDELSRRLGADQVPPVPVLTWAQVADIARGGITVGAHTHRHYILSNLDMAAAREDIATSLALIRDRVGSEPRGFAYPNGAVGDYSPETIRVLEELGVRWACTTRCGFATSSSHPLEIPRIHTSMDTLPLFAARLAGLTRLPDDDGGGPLAA